MGMEEEWKERIKETREEMKKIENEEMREGKKMGNE